MFAFFRGWKRKLGVATLVAACVLAAGWVNSLYGTHAVSFRCAGPDNLQGLLIINYRLVWLKTAPANHGCTLWPEVPLALPKYTRPSGRWLFGPQGFDNPEILWHWQIGIVGSGTLIFTNGPASWQARFLALPCWSIVAPLTLLSAWLLLSKSRLKGTIPARDYA